MKTPVQSTYRDAASPQQHPSSEVVQAIDRLSERLDAMVEILRDWQLEDADSSDTVN